eukprot:scaffold1638_cov258-Pinguiococcus_pyrenoidosus.AAC.89
MQTPKKTAGPRKRYRLPLLLCTISRHVNAWPACPASQGDLASRPRGSGAATAQAEHPAPTQNPDAARRAPREATAPSSTTIAASEAARRTGTQLARNTSLRSEARQSATRVKPAKRTTSWGHSASKRRAGLCSFQRRRQTVLLAGQEEAREASTAERRGRNTL